MQRFRFGLLPFAIVLIAAGSALAQDDLCPLNDEFDNPLTLDSWQQVHVTEQWNANQLEAEDIATTRPGFLTMLPYTVTWYANYRGPLRFKLVDGDFIMTTSVRVTGRNGVSAPSMQYSLGGIMIRTPRNITPATWTPGGENYVFLSIGYGNGPPSQFQYEVKTTIGSVSTLNLSAAPGPEARLRIARIGQYVIVLRREPGDDWRVHRRYVRNDFPDTLQAGMVTYTNWEKASDFSHFNHNRTALHLPLPGDVPNPTPAEPFNPDVITQYDFVRFARPDVPPPLVGADLSNEIAVTNAQLLTFLGDSVDSTCATVAVPEIPREPVSLRAPGIWSGDAPLRVALDVPAGSAWRLAAYDVLGRKIADVAEGIGAGAREIAWSGLGARGESLPSGAYFLSLTTGSDRRTLRVTRLP